MAVSRGPAAAPDRRNSRPSSASTASTGDAPRLTSDMISFRATVIHADPADLEEPLHPSARPLAATAVDDRKAAPGKRRHTVAGDSPDLVPRFSALKIDPAPASQQRAPPIGSGFMYARASSFTLGSSSSVAATYSFLPDQTPPPSASTTARPASALVTPSAAASATVYGALMRTAARLGDAPALLVPPTDRKTATASTVWTPPTESVSWAQLLARVRRSARVLLRLGFASGEALVVAARSSPDMYALHLAAVALGGAVAHVRSTWRSSDLADSILPAAKARVLVVDRLGDAVVDALGDAADSLRAVIVLDRDQDPVDLLLRVDAPVNVLTMADVEALAADDEASGTPSTEQVERAAASVSPAQCCAIEFGLDASGRIRGVKLSHDNVLFTAATVAQSLGPLSSHDRMLGYLPLHHVASQVLEIFVPVVCGLSVTCVPSSKPLMQVISTAKPTVLFATPATWSSVSSQVYRAKRDANAVLYRWAKTRATNNAKKQLFELKEQQGQPSSPRKKHHHRSLGYILAKKLVLNAIKRKIGLESCTACFSVLAPLDFELERLFQTVDLPLYQLGGTAEATGFAALNCPRAWELGAAGRALRRTLLRCDESTQDVLLRGRNVFMGHVRCEDGIVREEPHVGWLALPQRGFLTPTGFLTLNDPRDFVVLGTGDWVPIKPLERAITEDHPELARAVLIGDGRAFLSVLLFLQTAVPGASCTPTSFPSFQSQSGAVHSSNRGTRALGHSNQLGDDALQIARAIGSKATTVPEAIRCQTWAVYLDDLIESLPTRCAVAAAGFRVRKWMIMAGTFSVETGEIDPETGDVKRRAVEHKYQALLDTLYS